ncbi:3-isopropylmalate dehydratase large subunit [Persicobacter diffluens]|uniref:3-isopropylmalate dehydratase large subunit n=2 Tax=Persicobacter diffluens TaxID=981 RepID=A0AAN5AK76_9BACT|nr:3-isopropylmalate dehydratase large subunit [Persicobacter diffluens]
MLFERHCSNCCNSPFLFCPTIGCLAILLNNAAMMKKTLFDKIWEKHVVKEIENGPCVFYIDRHYVHEVTSPQAFAGLDARGMKVRRPDLVTATADHNVPTIDQHLPIKDELSAKQVKTLEENCANHGIEAFGLNHKHQGIVHVIGPEMGFTQPGMTIVCGDSHTSTHGAFGAIAFGIGTSEVEMVLTTQCLMQRKPKQMRINVDGALKAGVTAKDVVLYVISKLTTSGGTGYFVEFAGSTFRNMTMEERMTVCNMSIEMGARGGLIAPDQTTFDYLEGRQEVPKGADFEKAVAEWSQLFTEEEAVFDKEYHYDAQQIPAMITFGTNPGMGIGLSDHIPTADEVDDTEKRTLAKALDYMDFREGDAIAGKKIDYVFIGSCTNGRIEDLRAVAEVVKGHKKADHVTAWIVPGSKLVEEQAIEEGIKQVLNEAGFELRQPGCSACLAMNDDKIPAGSYCVSTSNRNFEGRQGPGSRTLLASPITAAKAAISGVVVEA